MLKAIHCFKSKNWQKRVNFKVYFRNIRPWATYTFVYTLNTSKPIENEDTSTF